jgi:hypothetical protein
MPYVGVTGVANIEQAAALIDAYGSASTDRQLALGVPVSYKTLAGIPSSIMLSMPQLTELYDAMRVRGRYSGVLFALHFFTIGLSELPEEEKAQAEHIIRMPLSSQAEMLIRRIYDDHEAAGLGFDLGLQINVSWPSPEEFKRIRQRFPGLKLILQVSNFDNFVEKVARYAPDHLLIDKSRGRQVILGMDESVGIYKLATERTEATIGFGGGFSPQNVHDRIRELIRLTGTKHFSIDAQGALAGADRKVDIEKVRPFLRNAEEAFNEKILETQAK